MVQKNSHRKSSSLTNHLPVGGVLVIFFAALLVCGCTSPAVNQGLVIAVEDPAMYNTALDLATNYQNESGQRVTVIEVQKGVEKDPGLEKADLLIADMSGIYGYAQQGRLKLLNPMLSNNTSVNWTVFESPTLALSGEYPAGSGEIYALPFSQDALALVYRSDIFNDPNESAVFCQTYGYPIGVPGTYDELAALASFFNRPDQGMAGIGFAGLNGSDHDSSPWMSLVSSYGVDVSSPGEMIESGFNDNAKVHAAADMLRNLSALEPGGAEGWGDQEVIDALLSGKTTMAITWYSLFPKIDDAAAEKNLSIGFKPLPGEICEGVSHRGIQVRVYGIGVTVGASDELADSFLNWFYSPEVQLRYARDGHQPAILAVIDSPAYLSMNLYNRGFPESMRVGVTLPKGSDSEKIRSACEAGIRRYIQE
ncbi:MAG TPA: ABC transporter substrate-binding protein [Methanospirillum sp.]|nr:ABC transporter substrate-binding protein [Methanospirillum sp.]